MLATRKSGIGWQLMSIGLEVAEYNGTRTMYKELRDNYHNMRHLITKLIVSINR